MTTEAAKGPDAFRTISEVAEELGLPQHVLRFWETRFPQIRPIKRGGGRRYYRPGDVELLRGVKQLLYGQGYTIRGVQRILREQGGRRTASAAGAAVPADVRDDDPPVDDVRIEPELSEGLVADHGGPDAWAPRMRRAEEADGDLGSALASHPAPAALVSEHATEPAPPALATGLTADQAERLAATVSELRECRRLLGDRSQ